MQLRLEPGAHLHHLGAIAHDPDPIDRHFQFAELEARLYRCRDLYDAAPAEYEEACRLHDAEMETICERFRTKWGKVPLLDTYRQMAIRQQKLKDWKACVWWTERGLALYGEDAAREDVVEDLLKRRNRALAKLQSSAEVRRPPQADLVEATVAAAPETSIPPMPTMVYDGEMETLVCTLCERSFERLKVRGRKPRLCPDCRRDA